MTLVEITYELQAPLKEDHFRRLGEFANTYGLRRFRVDSAGRTLTIEFDASRLRETQVAHALHLSQIPIHKKVENATAPASVLIEPKQS